MIGINRRHVAAGLIAIASLASASATASVAQAAQAPAARPAIVTRPAASSVNVSLAIGHCGRFTGTVKTSGAGTKRSNAILRVTGNLSNKCGVSFLQVRYTAGKTTVAMLTIRFDGFHQTVHVAWQHKSSSGTFTKVFMRLGNPYPKPGPIIWTKWVKA
jgi:hypothetical protein